MALRDALKGILDPGRSNEPPLGSPEGEAGTAPRAPYRILLAEDNAVNRKVARSMLQRQGHRVDVAENGRLALDAWRQGGVDLILVDVTMPEMDGFESTRAIRAEEALSAVKDATPPHIPILAMTANAMQGDEERCLAAGMDGYVSKPVRRERLMEEIERLMAAREAQS